MKNRIKVDDKTIIGDTNPIKEIISEDGYIEVGDPTEVTIGPYVDIVNAFRSSVAKDPDSFFKTLDGPVKQEAIQIYGEEQMVMAFLSLTLDVLENHLKGRNPFDLTKNHFSKVCNNAIDELVSMGDTKMNLY